MILGRVIGEVWATRKHAALSGKKLLIVRPHAWYAPAHEVGHLVAVDPVGAGIGEDVVVCLGDPARRALGGANLPVDAAVQAIVDRVELSSDLGRRPLTWIGEAPVGAPLP
jgi:ethanolamine utilization protein EutN